MSKKVLIFSLSYYPHVGGAEVAIKEITNRIDSAKARFDMVTLRFVGKNAPVEKIGNVNVHRIGAVDNTMETTDKLSLTLKVVKFFSPFLIFLKAVSLHRKHSYDILWVNNANHGGFAALLFK